MKRFKFLSVLAASLALIGLLWTVSDPQTTRTFLAADFNNPGALIMTGAGPHAIGGATSAGVGLNVLGFTGPSAVDTFGLQLAPPITVGAPTNAATFKITSAPTGATNNYALWVDAGLARFDSNVLLNINGPGNGLQGVTVAAAIVSMIEVMDVDTLDIRAPLSGTTDIIRFVKQDRTELARLTNGILTLGTTVTTGAVAGDLVSTKGWTTEAAGAAHGNAAANAVTIYIREDIDVGAGTATADCAIRARKSDGTEVNIVTLVTDAGCP